MLSHITDDAPRHANLIALDVRLLLEMQVQPEVKYSRDFALLTISRSLQHKQESTMAIPQDLFYPPELVRLLFQYLQDQAPAKPYLESSPAATPQVRPENTPDINWTTTPFTRPDTSHGLGPAEEFKSRDSTFTNCLRVSRAWYGIGKTILWQDVVLVVQNVGAFLKALSPSNVALIQSITTQGCNDHTVGYQTAITHIKDSMFKMCKLRALSVDEEEILIDTYQGVVESPDGAYSWLEKIPPSVENFELRGIGVISDSLNATDKSCTFLAKVLPQLRRLRLGGIRICPNIFHLLEACKILQEIIIDLGLRGSEENCTGRPYHGHQYHEHEVPAFVEAARSASERGCFPRIEHSVICGERAADDESEAATAITDCRYTIDMLRNTTTVYPKGTFMELDSAGRFVPVYNKSWMLYQDPSSQEEFDIMDEAFGVHNSQLSEGRTWNESLNLVRLPSALTQSRHYTWAEPENVTCLKRRAERSRVAAGLRSRLWYWENRVGRKLLHVKTIPGTILPDFPQRERLREELEMDPESPLAKELAELPF